MAWCGYAGRNFVYLSLSNDKHDKEVSSLMAVIIYLPSLDIYFRRTISKTISNCVWQLAPGVHCLGDCFWKRYLRTLRL